MPGHSHRDILKEIEGLVTEELQVVSFKWLARHFDVSATVAKQLLFSFVEQHKSRVSATYLLAGWTKQDDSCHTVQLVAQQFLQSKRASLKSETSLHVYSIQPSQPKDPAELWNTDSLQAKQLFEALLGQQSANCLSDNRHSAIACPDVRWDPAQSSAPPRLKDAQPAAPAPSSGKAAAMKSAVDKIVSGKALQKPTGGAASVAVDDDDDAARRGTTAAEAPTTTANEHAAAAEQAKPTSGAAKRTAMANGGNKQGSGNSGLAAMWSKAPAKKESARSKAGKAPARQQAAADGNDALRNAAKDEESCSSSDDDARPAAPARRVVRRGNNSRRIEEEESTRDQEDDIEVAVDEASKPSTAKQATKRNVLEESSDDESMEAAPAMQPPSARSYQALAEEKENNRGSKQDAKKRGRPSKASKAASQASHGNADQEAGEGDADSGQDQEQGPSGTAPAKRQRRGKPEPKYGSVKGSDTPAAGTRRRKVLRTTYNDKGEEVTEMVWEEDKTQSPSPEKDLPPEPEKAKESTASLASPSGKNKGGATAPAARGQPKPSSEATGRKGSKAGAKGKGGPAQKGIQSFFAKK